MECINSFDDFRSLQARVATMADPEIPTIVIPAGTCGRASGAQDLVDAARREILQRRLQDRLRLRVTGCHGFCEMEPSVLVEPLGTFYPRVSGADMARIIDAVLDGRGVEELMSVDSQSGAPVVTAGEVPFFKGQTRPLLSQNEKIDPLSIYSYLNAGGYSALVAVLEQQDPPAVIATVKQAGLRGRGGAGFPTATKWEMLAGQDAGRGKYVVCNADEGDPGAYMDRSLLEGNPHSIIEGMLICAFATGADRGVIYVRSEYPLAITHINAALEQARALGLVGEDILGSGFGFEIGIVKGAGAFVCGEETALINSIEGRMGEPRQRPPFPVQKGIEGRPTIINNVETWANVPLIFRRGAAAYAGRGEGASGTKIFSLVGKIKNTGLVEVPMGTPLEDVIYGIGGGPSGAAPIKAVQTGGPSGGCIPAAMFDIPIGYESLAQAGSIMGSGGMIVMDEHTCMVDVARYFMNFLKDESCGKCFVCRKGTQRMFELLDDITCGRGTLGHLDLLEELAYVVKDAAMCGLGQTAPNPILSTLRYFREEYLEHIENKRCPAGVCKALIRFEINADCKGCQACIKACPEDAIQGEKGEVHTIDQGLCVKCGACRNVCRFEAIDVCDAF